MILARNPRYGRGEVDLLARLGRELVAVEVKARRAPGMDPSEAFTPPKAAQVRRVASCLGRPVRRVDLVAVTVGKEGVWVRWVPWAG